MLDRLFSPADAARALRGFRKLARHDIRRWALTGGLAIEIHRLRLGCAQERRALNDLDFVADSFDAIPDTLAEDFLFRHVHPNDPPGRTLLQSVDSANALRIDLFRCFGNTMSRTSSVDLDAGPMRLISLEDLVARAARLAFDLAEGVPTPAKYARDFLRLTELTEPSTVETAWQDQRKAKHPATFAETDRLLRQLIPVSQSLLITPDYSKDAETVCPRCAPTAALRIAGPKAILQVLGYC